MTCRWRVPLRDCVDATPAVVATAAALAGDPHGAWWAFGCSHGGEVVCIEGVTGNVVWRAELSGRCDAGLAVTHDLRHVAVACGDGRLHFLDVATGAIAGKCDLAGDARAAPVIDPWDGDVWLPTHGRRLLVCRPPGTILWSCELPAPSSAAVTFDAGRRSAFVACLDGSVVCFRHLSAANVAEPAAKRQRTEPSEQGDSGKAVALQTASGRGASAAAHATSEVVATAAAAAAGGGLGGSIGDSGSTALGCFSVAWRHTAGSPVFGRPVVDAAAGALIVGLVSGHVLALSAAGAALWRTDVGAPLFTPLSLLRRAPAACNQPAGMPGSNSGSDGSGSNSGGAIVLVPDQSGCISGMCLACGRLLWSHTVCSGSGGGEASLRIGPMVRLPSHQQDPAASALVQQVKALASRQQQLVWTDGPGAAGILDIPIGAARHTCAAGAGNGAVYTDSAWEAPADAPSVDEKMQRRHHGSPAAAALPAETFSAPLGLDGQIIFGCRDDHLYCIV